MCSDPQGGSLGSWASRVGTPVTAEEQERGQGGRKGMEGGERTWGRGSISLVPGDPLCHRQAPVQKLREKERDQVGKTVGFVESTTEG